MRTQTECWTLTSKNSAKLKQYNFFHAEFLEEIQYIIIYTSNQLLKVDYPTWVVADIPESWPKTGQSALSALVNDNARVIDACLWLCCMYYSFLLALESDCYRQNFMTSRVFHLLRLFDGNYHVWISRSSLCWQTERTNNYYCFIPIASVHANYMYLSFLHCRSYHNTQSMFYSFTSADFSSS